MEDADELRARINLALSVLSHRTHCDDCKNTIQTAIAALEGVPYEVLIREAG
jgi:hypothetical protein